MAAAVKWADPAVTAEGKQRATVSPIRLKTLWFNTGTLCNLTCAHCYIESSPSNNRLSYLTTEELIPYLEEARRENLGTEEIGFTGGEPFLNPDMIPMADAALTRGFRVLLLTNAMKPLSRKRAALSALRERFGDALHLRVSLDHYTEKVHDAERGTGSWPLVLAGLRWLTDEGFSVSVAGRSLTDEGPAAAKKGFQGLFAQLGIRPDLVIFPEMDAKKDLPEITTECWGILQKDPATVMCASARMVVKRRGAAAASVVACTLLPYDERFSLGKTLQESWRPVSLVHPHCASFCVLGGASCS